MYHVVLLSHDNGLFRFFFLVRQVCPAEFRMRQPHPQDSGNNYHAHRNALHVDTRAERGSNTGPQQAVADEQCSEPVEMRMTLAGGQIARRQHETTAHQIVANGQENDCGRRDDDLDGEDKLVSRFLVILFFHSEEAWGITSHRLEYRR